MPKSLLILAACLFFTACQSANQNANQNTTATTTVTPPQIQQLSTTPRPQSIVALMQQRGAQDEARPVLKIVEPAPGATVKGFLVSVKLTLSGDLKGYQTGLNQTGTGNHINVILDNQPYEAYYQLNQPFELRNVSAGRHILRVFAARPWQESYKNPEAFAMVAFTVVNAPLEKPPAGPQPTPEGKNMAASQAGEIDLNKPLLTYSRPQGEYKDAEADAIMIDFWLSQAQLAGDGGAYRVRYAVDDKEPQFVDKWQPIWLTGWTAGEHKVKLELVDRDGQVVSNGDYNSIERKIMVTRGRH
jgi:hypothetical protein